MKTKLSAVLVLMGALAFASATVNAATMTMTGEVSDSMCGASHPIKDAAACTRACVAKGADYVLVVNDKVYTLKSTNAQKAELSKLAGMKATVTGDVNGNTVTIASLKMAK
jgi:hypothetical protein